MRWPSWTQHWPDYQKFVKRISRWKIAWGVAAMVFALASCSQTQVKVHSRLNENSAFKSPVTNDHVLAGRKLFLKNCAHCHGSDAHGDEGPDLHGLKKSNEWISKRIRNGVKGEMTAFGEKFQQQDVDVLIAYLRSLK
jgi:mono/diheme cytochrome c family protein